MIRFTLTADGKARVVDGKNRTGRGIYICPDVSCVKKARKRHDFEPVSGTVGFEEGLKEKSLEGV